MKPYIYIFCIHTGVLPAYNDCAPLMCLVPAEIKEPENSEKQPV